MEDLFKAVRDINLDQEAALPSRKVLISPLSDDITEVNSRDIQNQRDKELREVEREEEVTRPVTVEDAIAALKHKPDSSTLAHCLQILSGTSPDGSVQEDHEASVQTPSLKAPGPQSSRVAALLVDEILPHHWTSFNTSAAPLRKNASSAIKRGRAELRARNSFLQCLRTITGLSALTAALVRATAALAAGGKRIAEARLVGQVQDLLEVISGAIANVKAVSRLWVELRDAYGGEEMKILVAWKELVGLLAGGRLLSVCLEAITAIRTHGGRAGKKLHWLDDPKRYSKWLGQSLLRMLEPSPAEDNTVKATALMCGRALHLGYPEVLVKALITAPDAPGRLSSTLNIFLPGLLSRLQLSERKQFLIVLLGLLDKALASVPELTGSKKVGGAAALLHMCTSEDASLRAVLKGWLLGVSSTLMIGGINLSRAVLLVLTNNDDMLLGSILAESISSFGDKDYLRHTPVSRQEELVQVMLLTAGRLKKALPDVLLKQLRSGAYLTAVSNRLGSSSMRPRVLGMIVGETFSSLVDKKDDQMDLDDPMTKNEDSMWYRSLVNIFDQMGTIEDLGSLLPTSVTTPSKRKPTPSKPAPAPESPPEPALEINQLSDGSPRASPSSSTPSSPDLMPYAKPDSDPSDSDSDPTLINRSKPSPPIYIRDLLLLLRTRDSADKQSLALLHASPLIRRKSSFGTEVSAHALELASLLLTAKDDYELEAFEELRLAGLVAVLVAEPGLVGPWFVRAYFEGDYALGQRAVVLAAVAHAAREIAGVEGAGAEGSAEGEKGKGKKVKDGAGFPSKRLPPALEAVYGSSSGPHAAALTQGPKPMRDVARLMSSLTDSMLEPRVTAATARAHLQAQPRVSATTTTTKAGAHLQPQPHLSPSPSSALKPLSTRTFSTRMAIERSRPKPRDLTFAPVLAQSFFFPLTARFSAHLVQASRSRLGLSASSPYSTSNPSSSSSSTGRGSPAAAAAAAAHINGFPATSLDTTTTHSPVTHPLLLTQYLQTLTLILAACGPTAAPTADMAPELLQLLLGVRRVAAVREEVGVLVQVLGSLLAVLEICAGDGGVGERRLVGEFAEELVEVRGWVGGVFEAAGGAGGGRSLKGLGGGRGEIEGMAVGGDFQRVRMLCAAILLGVQRMMDGYQNSLLGL